MLLQFDSVHLAIFSIIILSCILTNRPSQLMTRFSLKLVSFLHGKWPSKHSVLSHRLDCSFYDIFLRRRMKMMLNIQEYACLRIPWPSICWNTTFSIFSNQRLYKPLSHKLASFNGGTNTRNRIISGLHSNWQTYIAIFRFDQYFIYELRWFASSLE